MCILIRQRKQLFLSYYKVQTKPKKTKKKTLISAWQHENKERKTRFLTTARKP